MKKIVLFLLSFAVIFSAFGVSAASVPNFMAQPYNNYTADYTVSMIFEDGAEIASLLEETGVSEYIDRYIDIKSFLNSLLSTKTEMNVQLKISEDYRRADLAMTAKNEQGIDFNRNLSMDYKANMGMWLHMNLDKEEFRLIYSTPINHKYMVFDAAEQLPEEARVQVFDVFGKIFSKDFIDGVNASSLQLMAEHADISMKGSSCVIKYSNDSFTAMLDDAFDYAFAQLENIGTAHDVPMSKPQIPSLRGVQILGDDGITYTYNLKGTKISRADVKADICVSIKDIYTKMTGEQWPYESDGKVSIEIKSEVNFTKLGTTNPVMPETTEENSFPLIDKSMLQDEYYYNYEEYAAEPFVYPYAYCWEAAEVCENGVYYAPLRALIEDAYFNGSEIVYNRGSVIVNLQNPEGEQHLNFYVGTDEVLVRSGGFADDDTTVKLSAPAKVVDGSVYVSVDFFEKCLGWQLEEMSKDMLGNTMCYGFYTGR